jgi:hypothetical protein
MAASMIGGALVPPGGPIAITTAAPSSAIRSRIVVPMPYVAPVKSATFPTSLMDFLLATLC